MSYGFSVRGATVALALAAVGPKFDEVVASQPVHAKDRDVAIATATAIADLVGEPDEGQEVSITVGGWLQWQVAVAAGEVPDAFTGASVSASASIVPAGS
ncbi:hypothetical protein [Sphingomonas mali]|uniref:hypothetical protein n=1 Tax=Sphingomonas mali TaxID=40682 RepID=UPI0008326E70|nr:hypothetical protein [Sphingomonas mali]